jgi:hypothetical protein
MPFSALPPFFRPASRPALPLLPAVLAAALLAAGCGERAKEAVADEAGARRSAMVKTAGDQSLLPPRELDPESLKNMTFLLAGTTPPGTELSPAWAQHRAEMEKLFARIEPRFAAMSSWSGQELVRLPASEAPVFFPFGGPDLFSVLSLFPDASSYILVGLQAPGRLPMPEDTAHDALEGDLERLRKPFESLADAGYFARSEIDQELSGGHFDGLLPILLIALARSGQVPEAVQYLRLESSSGQLVGLEPSATTAGAVRILFRPAVGRGKIRSVFYYAQNLSNDAVFPDAAFSRMIEKLGTLNVVVKLGEYLLHGASFSNLRRLILDRSQVVLQDDSGVPLRFFTSDRWKVELYGHYEGVPAAYKEWLQPDLAAAFRRKGEVRSLTYAAGYATTPNGGCLILASRKDGSGRGRREIGR